jgi:hypothetical protein
MEEPNMLGIMTMPSSYPVYKATGQTLRIGNQYGFIWNPSVDYSPYVPIGYTGYFPVPLLGTWAPVGTTYYYDTPTRQYVNTPWLVRATARDGEATVDVSSLDMTLYAGDDVGSTPYQICVKDQAGGEAWGFLGAVGGGPVETEMLTGWTESVSEGYDFDVFTTSGSTITEMKILDTLGNDGLAYTNAITIVEGHRYQLVANVTLSGGFHYYPDLYLGTPEVVGRMLKDDLIDGIENKFQFIASAEDAAQTCLWIYVGGNSDWTNCTFTMVDITGPITGSELLTGWTAGETTSKSDAIAFVEGRKYRIYTNYSNFINTIYVRLGSADAMDGRAIGYLRGDHPNYFEFTATAADVTGGRVWIESVDALVYASLSLFELTEQNVTLGGVHIVSTDGGSTRNWTSIAENFDWNDIRSYQIMEHDAVALTAKKYYIQVRDVSTNKWARGWLGAEGTGAGEHIHHTLLTITKATNGIVTFNHSCVSQDLHYYDGLSEMTELNGKYLTFGDSVSLNLSCYLDWDTSGYGAAETTGASIENIYQPPATALKVFNGANIADEDFGNQSWTIEEGFKFNRTDYEVYITLER